MLEELKKIEALKKELALLKSGQSGLEEPYVGSEIISLENELQRVLKQKI